MSQHSSYVYSMIIQSKLNPSLRVSGGLIRSSFQVTLWKLLHPLAVTRISKTLHLRVSVVWHFLLLFKLRSHFGAIVLKFLFAPCILDYNFFATLHSRLSSWKRTLRETDESFSFSRTYYILWSRSVYYHFQKIIGP